MEEDELNDEFDGDGYKSPQTGTGYMDNLVNQTIGGTMALSNPHPAVTQYVARNWERLSRFKGRSQFNHLYKYLSSSITRLDEDHTGLKQECEASLRAMLDHLLERVEFGQYEEASEANFRVLLTAFNLAQRSSHDSTRPLLQKLISMHETILIGEDMTDKDFMRQLRSLE